MDTADVPWLLDWLWGLPLIIVNVVGHVIGLGLITARAIDLLERERARRRFLAIFAGVIGGTALLATVLHGLGALIWAFAYLRLGALPDIRAAMLYSVSAMTTYGHHDVYLAPPWQMMGALEALAGMLLFGLTTAFLFAVIQKVWPLGNGGRTAKGTDN